MLALATSVKLLPRKVLFDVIYNARQLNAEEALAYGLVTKVVAPSDLRTAVREQAEELAKRSPVALAIGRRAYESMLGMGLDEALDYGGAMLVHLLASGDALEAYQAKLRRSVDRLPGRMDRLPFKNGSQGSSTLGTQVVAMVGSAGPEVLSDLRGSRPGRLPVLRPGDPRAAPRAPMLRFDGGNHEKTSRAFFEMRSKVGDRLARQLR